MLDVPTKRLRFEVINNRDRYTLIFEGQITKEKVLRLLDLIELLGGMPNLNREMTTNTNISKIEKIRIIAEEKFLMQWFS